MRKITVFGYIISLLVLCSGCATIISGSTQQIAFDSNPDKADVYVNEMKTCTTPCVTILQRSKLPPIVKIKKEGYEDAIVPLMSRFNYWTLANVFWGYTSTTGFAVDLMNTGSTVEYDPNRYFTTLTPIKGSKKESRSELLLFVVANHDELINDISRGAGEYLSALYDLTRVEKDKEAAVLSKLKELSVRHEDTVEFARAVEKTL